MFQQPSSLPIAAMLVMTTLFGATSSPAAAETVLLASTSSARNQVSVSDATSSSTNYGSLYILGGMTTPVTLPDIVISENYAGAIRARAWIAIGADYRAFTAFDSSTAALKAYRLDNGADVSAAILAGNTLNTDASPSAANIADVSFQLVAPSGQDSGPIKLVISGLKATPGNPNPDDFSIKVGGADEPGNSLDSLAKIDSLYGAGVAAQNLKVGTLVCAVQPASGNAFTGCGKSPPPIPVSEGPLTARTITLPPMQPAGLDIGKPGSFFVAVVAFSFGNIFFMDSQMRWSPFKDCSSTPAYLSGLLETSPSIPVLATPTDLSGLRGLQLVMGYGLASADAPAGTACQDMLRNARYNIAYTVN